MKNISKEKLRSLVGKYENFPKKGITFLDLNPLLYNTKARLAICDDFAKNIPITNKTIIAAPEARGFIWASLFAQQYNLPLIPIRKKGKLPGSLMVQSYDLEYGTGELFIQASHHHQGFKKGSDVVIVDDVLATGGTAVACAKLVKKIGGRVAAFYFVLGIATLKGESELKEYSRVIHTSLNF